MWKKVKMLRVSKYVVSMATLTVAISATAQGMQERELAFSNIRSVSPTITKVECEALFAGPVQVASPTQAQLEGKESIINSRHPVSFNPLVTVEELHSLSNIASALYFTRIFEGKAKVVRHGGNALVHYWVVSTINPKSGDVSGHQVLGALCAADYKSRLV